MMKDKGQEQIKIDGVYYTVNRNDRKLLQDMEASLYGCCTTEGVKEFQKAIQDIKNRSTERNFEFDVYLTNYTDLNTEVKPMQQLRLMSEQLIRIGFGKHKFGNEIRYAIDFVNGCFYYNSDDVNFTWYQRVEILGGYNHIHLNIRTISDLFKLLTIFQIKFNLIEL
jgi:hypothetical protein